MIKKKMSVIEKAKNHKNEFLEFLNKYNIIELSIAFVVGGAAKDLVSSIANDMIMPIVGIISPSGSWRDLVFTVAGSDFKIGNLLGSLLNFLIIALLVFIIIKKILKLESDKD